MTRLLAVLLAAALVAAAPAHAKGPHAILDTGPDPVEAGAAWKVTVALMETDASEPPSLIARRDDRIVAARGRRAGSDGLESRYAFELVLPAPGRWRLTLVHAKRRFEFAAVGVGSGRAPQDYVAFPEGSRAEREGAGGVYYSSGDPAPAGGGESLPPEVVDVGASEAGGGGDDGGVPMWLFPVAGVVLAGAGLLRLRSR